MADNPKTLTSTPATFLHLVKAHLDLRPKMQFQDVYKLLFQSVLGAGHIPPNRQSIIRALHKELAALQPGDPKEPLTESIHPGASMLRINLRPFQSRGLDVEALADCFHNSSLAETDTKESLKRIWEHISSHPDVLQRIKQSRSEILAFVDSVVAMNYPLSHHSPIYKKYYYPAYRVVNQAILIQHFKDIMEAK